MDQCVSRQPVKLDGNNVSRMSVASPFCTMRMPGPKCCTMKGHVFSTLIGSMQIWVMKGLVWTILFPSSRSCLSAAVLVGIARGLFAQHDLDAVATGTMLEAQLFLPLIITALGS